MIVILADTDPNLCEKMGIRPSETTEHIRQIEQEIGSPGISAIMSMVDINKDNQKVDKES